MRFFRSVTINGERRRPNMIVREKGKRISVRVYVFTRCKIQIVKLVFLKLKHLTFCINTLNKDINICFNNEFVFLWKIGDSMFLEGIAFNDYKFRILRFKMCLVQFKVDFWMDSLNQTTSLSVHPLTKCSFQLLPQFITY